MYINLNSNKPDEAPEAKGNENTPDGQRKLTRTGTER